MRKPLLLLLIIFTIALLPAQPEERRIIDSKEIVVKLVLDSSANSYEIGFCDGEGRPIEETRLKINPDSGSITDDGNTYIYWNITSVSPFDVSLGFAPDGTINNLEPTVAVDGIDVEESDGLSVFSARELSGFYSREVVKQVDITTGVSAEEAGVGFYSGSLVLTITA